MTLTQRRFLTLFLGLLLLVASPLIILYAAGYRYNFEKFRIEKVGLLYVTTDPNDTKISVNGQQYTVGNELVLRSLPQGEHDITLTLDGYHTWSKKLDIYKGQSTFITDQILFLDQEPEPFELFTNKLTHLFSKDDTHFFQTNDYLFVYNFANKELDEIQLNSDSPVLEIDYSPELDLILFYQDNQWLSLNKNTANISPIVVPESTEQVVLVDNNIFAIATNGIYFVTESIPKLFLDIDYAKDLISGNQGYWVLTSDSNNNHNFLYQVLDITQRPLLVNQFPYSESFSLIEDYRGFLTAHDEVNHILYLVDTSTTIPTTESLFGVRNWKWSKNHSQLLTSSEFELTIHHFENGIRQELLLRLSEPISDIGWYGSETHVFYTTDTDLYLIERDARDKRNQFELADVSADHLLLGSDEDSIEYFSSLEKASFFFKRGLRE